MSHNIPDRPGNTPKDIANSLRQTLQLANAYHEQLRRMGWSMSYFSLADQDDPAYKHLGAELPRHVEFYKTETM